MSAYDYVAIGHVSRDVVEQTGAVQPGGGALYSGLQAARLGLRTLVLTAGVPSEVEALVEPFSGELDLRVQPAAETTSFEAQGTDVGRRLRLTGWAGPIDLTTPIDARILHLAPVAAEIAGAPPGVHRFVGVTPQGLVRHWGRDGLVSARPIDLEALPPRCDALVLGGAELGPGRAAIDRVLAEGGVVSVTHGPAGAEARSASGSVRMEALGEAAVAEDLGAGDVYAAAFFVALAGGASPREAVARGQAAALIRLRGTGPGAVGDQEEIAQLVAASGPASGSDSA